MRRRGLYLWGACVGSPSKLECLTAGCWPAWWAVNDGPNVGGEVDVDDQWHSWRMQWDEPGIRFWKDWAPAMAPYFDVPAGSVPGWPFNNPGYQMYPVLNLAVGGSGGGDARPGTYPAQMLVDSCACLVGHASTTKASYVTRKPGESRRRTGENRSLPGLGVILGARVLGEFGHDPNRYTTAKSRKNYAETSPLT